MIRVAVIGAGWYAVQNHIPVLAARKDVALDGVCRLGRGALRRVREAFGFAFASEDHHEILARRPDAVIVASPHHLHYRHASDALAAGAHVLCEKPMTLDPAEAWDLVASARQHDRHLLIANGYQYLPHLPEIRDLVRGGALGPIEHLMCSFVSATRQVFDGGRGLARWETAFFRPEIGTWRDPARGGGFAYGQLSHAIALLLWLTGLVPLSVAARTFGTGPIDLCDAAVMAFEGGAVGSLSGAAAMPDGERALLRFIITGRDGVLTIDMDRDSAEARLQDGTVRAFAIAPGDWVYNCIGPVEALVELAQGGGENRAPGEIGAATVAVIAAMLQSAQSGGSQVEVMPGMGGTPLSAPLA